MATKKSSDSIPYAKPSDILLAVAQKIDVVDNFSLNGKTYKSGQSAIKQAIVVADSMGAKPIVKALGEILKVKGTSGGPGRSGLVEGGPPKVYTVSKARTITIKVGEILSVKEKDKVQALAKDGKITISNV